MKPQVSSAARRVASICLRPCRPQARLTAQNRQAEFLCQNYSWIPRSDSPLISSAILMHDSRRRLHHFNRQCADLAAIGAKSEFIDTGVRHDDMLKPEIDVGMA